MANAPLRAPLITTIEITNYCNLRCRYCYSHSGITHMPVDIVVQWLSDLNDRGVWELVIAGGEPFLHPGIITILRKIGALGIAVGITTNGTMLRGRRLKEYAAVCDKYPGIFDLQVSVDGPTPEENDVLRGGGSLVFRAIDEIQQLGLSIGIGTVLTKHNVELAQRIVEHFYPKIKRFHFIGLMPSYSVDVCQENLFAGRDQLQKAYSDLRSIGKVHSDLILSLPRKEYGVRGEEMPTMECVGCIGATTRLDINATGDVLACNIADTSVIGNIYEEDFDTIWNSSAANSCRSESIPLCIKASQERRSEISNKR